MGKNVFISYKYGDCKVCSRSIMNSNARTINDYVLDLKNRIDSSNVFYDRSEDLNEDLSHLNEKQIERILADKIFYTSITLILVSAGMKEKKLEREQWIPWEISYSLKEKNRSKGDSNHNAVLAIVIPDGNGSYDYALKDNHCCKNGCVTTQNSGLFEIISKNRFNIKNPSKYKCSDGREVLTGDNSYIQLIKWEDFVKNMTYYIDKAYEIRNNIERYDMVKRL